VSEYRLTYHSTHSRSFQTDFNRQHSQTNSDKALMDRMVC